MKNQWSTIDVDRVMRIVMGGTLLFVIQLVLIMKGHGNACRFDK